MKMGFILAVASMGLVSCGSTSTKSTSSFKVRMLGTYILPVGATGTSNPRSNTLLFHGLTLTDSAGTEVAMYKDDPKTLKIIDRGQIVFQEANMTTYNGTIFTSAVVKFDPTVIVTSKTNTATEIVLATGDLSLVESFTVTKSKEQVLTIKVEWGDTIAIADDGTESVTAPTFSLKYEAQ